MAVACGDGLVRILRYNFLSKCNLIIVYESYLKAPDLQEITDKGPECLEFSLGKRFPMDHVRIGLGWNKLAMKARGGISLKRE